MKYILISLVGAIIFMSYGMKVLRDDRIELQKKLNENIIKLESIKAENQRCNIAIDMANKKITEWQIDNKKKKDEAIKKEKVAISQNKKNHYKLNSQISNDNSSLAVINSTIDIINQYLME